MNGVHRNLCQTNFKNSSTAYVTDSRIIGDAHPTTEGANLNDITEELTCELVKEVNKIPTSIATKTKREHPVIFPEQEGFMPMMAAAQLGNVPLARLLLDMVHKLKRKTKKGKPLSTCRLKRTNLR